MTKPFIQLKDTVGKTITGTAVSRDYSGFLEIVVAFEDSYTCIKPEFDGEDVLFGEGDVSKLEFGDNALEQLGLFTAAELQQERLREQQESTLRSESLERQHYERLKAKYEPNL